MHTFHSNQFENLSWIADDSNEYSRVNTSQTMQIEIRSVKTNEMRYTIFKTICSN